MPEPNHNRSETLDPSLVCPQQYSTRKTLLDYERPPGSFLCVDGVGAPGAKLYQEAIQRLFSVVYTGKFTLKGQGVLDFKILPLECFWGEFDPEKTPREQWHWTLAIQIPPQFTTDLVAMIRGIILERRGEDVGLPSIRTIAGGRCLQLLHVGPYERLALTYAQLQAAAADKGVSTVPGRHQEVYLSDPRRVPAERLRTIVRVFVEALRKDEDQL